MGGTTQEGGSARGGVRFTACLLALFRSGEVGFGLVFSVTPF
jgi:hypothetical protein